MSIKKIVISFLVIVAAAVTVKYIKDVTNAIGEDKENREQMKQVFKFTELLYRQYEDEIKLKYRKFPARLNTPCGKDIIVKKQYMPWDDAGKYPVLYEDIKIYCKPAGKKIILAMGDSITGGLGLPRDKVWTELLNNELNDAVVVNAGINASNTFHWDPDHVLYDRVVRQNAADIDIVLLLVGGNDINYYATFNDTVFRDGLDSRYKKLTKALKKDLPDAEIIVSNYPRWTENSKFDVVDSFWTSAASSGSGFIMGPDFKKDFDYNKIYFLADKTHLSVSGNEYMKIIWKDFLARKLNIH